MTIGLKVKMMGVGYRKLVRYLKYHEAPMIDKIIVLSLMAERRFFNFFYYFRTKIRNKMINRVYKHHGDHNWHK